MRQLRVVEKRHRVRFPEPTREEIFKRRLVAVFDALEAYDQGLSAEATVTKVKEAVGWDE